MAARHAGDFYALLPALSRRFGDVVRLRIPFLGQVTVLANPAHVEYVMVRRHDRYVRHRITGDMVVGEAGVIPLLVGESLKKWRQPLNPFFTEMSMEAVSRSMADAVADGVDSWSANTAQGSWIDLEHELGVVVLDAVMRSLFGTTWDAETKIRFVTASRDLGSYTIGRAVMLPLPRVVPRPHRRRGEEGQRLVLAQLDELLAERLASGPLERQPDVLDALMAMPFEGSAEQQYRRLRTEVSTMIFAAFETTAQTVAWSIALLSTEPAVLAAAYDEVDTLAGEPIEYAHLDRLPYLRACFDETMRVVAPPAFLRRVDADDEIDGYFIPRDSHILISPHGLHRDERFWEKPDEFNPDRFLAGKINRNAYVPFNTGPRKCMGWRMAYIDGVMTLAAVLQRYRFEIKPGWTPRTKLRLSAGLVGGLPVRLTDRRESLQPNGEG